VSRSCKSRIEAGPLFLIYGARTSFISNLYTPKTRFPAPVLDRVEGETPMVALAFLVSTASAIWDKVHRSLKSVFVAMCESQMRRAQMELDRYHRRHAPLASSEDVRM